MLLQWFTMSYKLVSSFTFLLHFHSLSSSKNIYWSGHNLTFQKLTDIKNLGSVVIHTCLLAPSSEQLQRWGESFSCSLHVAVTQTLSRMELMDEESLAPPGRALCLLVLHRSRNV